MKLLSLLMAGMILLSLAGGCRPGGTDADAVFDDMRAALEQSGFLSANIGLFSKAEENGSISYHNGGSGVIFRRDGAFYYALTAKHVVDSETAKLLVYTVNTEMKLDVIPGLEDMNVLAHETYDSMYTAEVLYKSDRGDLAVIRFAADEELAVMALADADPEIGDRIMCVGNPDNKWFSVSYGRVLTVIKQYGDFTDYLSSVMEHSAYMASGSSGGAAINEQLELVGITPGIVVGIDGSTFDRGVLIPASELRLCLEAWSSLK